MTEVSAKDVMELRKITGCALFDLVSCFMYYLSVF
jgi:hypothetical protein